jgi:hypothetical protein
MIARTQPNRGIAMADPPKRRLYVDDVENVQARITNLRTSIQDGDRSSDDPDVLEEWANIKQDPAFFWLEKNNINFTWICL